MPKFTMDVKLWATVEVQADSQAEAETLIKHHVDGSSANLGAWPNGDPIVSEVSQEGEIELIMIDGEAP